MSKLYDHSIQAPLLTIGTTVVLMSDFVKRNRVYAKDASEEAMDAMVDCLTVEYCC